MSSAKIVKDESAHTGAKNQPLLPQQSETEIARQALFVMTKLLKAAGDSGSG